MKIIKTFFDDEVKLIEIKKYTDERGYFYENYNQSKMNDFKLDTYFVQDNFSYSIQKGVIRGLHIQVPPMSQIKLISVIKGKILDVFVDLRKHSKTYGKHEKIVLSQFDLFNIFIPDGFAHGFSVLEDETLVFYKTNNFYSVNHEQTIIYNDKKLDIDWQINENRIISDKDKNGMKFNEFDSPF